MAPEVCGSVFRDQKVDFLRDEGNFWAKRILNGHKVKQFMVDYMKNSEYQDHCRDNDNIYCCDKSPWINEMEKLGKDCVKAEGYNHNRKPVKKGEKSQESGEKKHDNYSEEHHSHHKISQPAAKIRVQHKPLIPDEAVPTVPFIKIPGIGPKVPNQYRR